MQQVNFKLFLFSISMVCAGFFSVATAQTITAADKKKLQVKEDSLAEYAKYLITDTLTEDRMVSDSIFVKTLIRSLQIKNSFYYPFDSVIGVSKLYAPDSTFRIFTWNLQYDNYYGRQRGAIQMRTRDGSLKLFPLRDVSEFTDNAMDSARTRNNWIGAVYYNIIKTQHQGKSYYTLFGFDGHGVRSSKKWIEVLHFNPNGEPIFGGEFFSFSTEARKRNKPYRFSLEYKKDARVLANFLKEENVILIDHLISESDEPDNPWTLIPDGDNEGFKWENGKWVHVEKVFDYKVDMTGADPYLGRPPLEAPILGKDGKRDEKKLMEQSIKNKAKEKPPVKKD